LAVVRFTCPPPCGHTLSADGEEALVEAVREHARLVHGHELIPGDVRRLMAAHGQLPVRWHLAGTYIEHCSCHSVCPCTTSGLALPADTERCQAVAAWRIDRGAIGGLEVSGLSVAMLIDAPRYMGTPHSWRVGL
jgi:predicted small metal-binding protein